MHRCLRCASRLAKRASIELKCCLQVPHEIEVRAARLEACRIDFRCPWTRTGRRCVRAGLLRVSHKGGPWGSALAREARTLVCCCSVSPQIVRAQLISQAALRVKLEQSLKPTLGLRDCPNRSRRVKYVTKMAGADVAPQCANQISRVMPARHRRDVRSRLRPRHLSQS